MMANKLGSENVSVNCEYTKKNCTKLSFISNTDKIILSITPYDINNKEIDYEEINLIKKQKKELKEQKKNKLNKILIENKELKNKLKNIIIDDKVKNKNLNENEIKIKEKNEVEDKVENKVEKKVKNKVEEEIKEIGKIKKIKTS